MSPRKAKATYTAADWPAEGRLSPRGWCMVCRSYWCPHAAPKLYEPRDLSRFYRGGHPGPRKSGSLPYGGRRS